MTPVWMLYLAATALLLALAARLAEEALRLLDRPVRGAWLTAMAGSLLLPLLARSTPGAGVLDALARWLGGAPAASATGSGAAGGGESVVLFLPETAWGVSTGLSPALDRAALLLWGLSSAAALLFVAHGHLRLRRRARAWPARRVGGSLVRVSRNTGPAVLGLLRPLVVLPERIFELAPERRRLVLLHEREHLAGRDPAIVSVALAILVAMPWNLPLWWAFRRLRLAVETDCDRRVLDRTRNPLAYGRLLLEVGADSGAAGLPVAALAEPKSNLEERIRSMTRPSPKHPVPKAAGLALAIALLVAAACDAPSPPDPGVSGPSDVAADVEAAPNADGPGDAASSAGESDPAPRADRDTEPRLLNPVEVRSALRDAYPEELKDAGVDVRTRVRIRGDGSLGTGPAPLVFVDGREFGRFEPGEDGGLQIGDRDLRADDIESISVLKGPAAAEEYGADGEHGVILITTKGGGYGPGR